MAGPCHVAFNVSQEDFDRMLELIPACGGANQGDFRSEDGLRAPGERSIYFSDPDTNKLQITALGKEDWSLISDEEKWQTHRGEPRKTRQRHVALRPRHQTQSIRIKRGARKTDHSDIFT